MTNALIVASYAMAAAFVGAVLNLVGHVPAPLAAMVGFCQILLCIQLHTLILRRRERNRVSAELHALRHADREVRGALEQTHAKIDEITEHFEARSTAQSQKVVSELRMLEGLMREFAERIAEKSKAQPRPVAAMLEEPRPEARIDRALDQTSEPALLEAIRLSLEQNRVDLYLQPIVSLPQRKLRHYEALSRLRAADGSLIMPAQYIRVAEPAGLMSVVDNLLLFRCVQLVRRLFPKQREIAVFCNISGDTLSDDEFFPQFLEYMHHNRDLAGQIVFEFAQDAVAKAGPRGEENLSYLARLGFALSMDHVGTLALDFARLRAIGFRYIKVRAEMLIGGMNGAKSDVAAEDFKALLQRNGLDLIAEHVEDERTVVQLLDYSVDFAQGFLLGEPRAVREEGVRQPETELTAPVIPFRRAS